MLRTRLLALVLLLVACGESDEPTEAAPAGSSGAVQASEPATTWEAEPTTREAAEPPALESPAPSPETRARRQRLLREGRQLARRGDMATALERFEALVELAPRSPSVLCEAGYIAHRAESETAEPLLRRGMSAFAALRIDDERLLTMARCEYNLGLVYQAANYLYRAERSYADSLRHRDNDTVRARLTSVRAEIEDLEHRVVAQSVSDMLTRLLDRDDADQDEDDGCDWGGTVLREMTQAGQSAGFLEVSAVDCYMSGGGALYFAFGAPEEVTAYVVDFFDEEDPEAAATNSSEWGGFAFSHIGDEVGGYWHARYTSTEHHTVYEDYAPPPGNQGEANCAYSGRATWTTEHTVVCSVTAERCVNLTTAQTVARSAHDITCGEDDVEVPDWALEHVGLSREALSASADPAPEVRFRVRVQFESEAVRIQTLEGEHTEHDAPPDGVTTLDSLLRAPHIGVAALHD